VGVGRCEPAAETVAGGASGQWNSCEGGANKLGRRWRRRLSCLLVCLESNDKGTLLCDLNARSKTDGAGSGLVRRGAAMV